MNENKYNKYFSESMSSDECRSVYFSLCSGLTEKELEELKQAYHHIQNILIPRELDYAQKNSMMK